MQMEGCRLAFIKHLCACSVTQSCLTVGHVAPWTVAPQAPLSTGFPRQEYWRGLPFPPSGDLPDPNMEPVSLVSPTLAGRLLAPPGETS